MIVNDNKVPVHKDVTEFSLTDLDPDSGYTIYMVASYEGEQMSDSKPVSFKTGNFV